MWFKNKRKIEELDYKIAKITNFNKTMIKIGAFNGCVGKYVRTVGHSSSFSYGDAIACVDLSPRIYKIVMVIEPGSFVLQDFYGRMRDFPADEILGLASNDEISDFKYQEFKKSKRYTNKGQTGGDIIGCSN